MTRYARKPASSPDLKAKLRLSPRRLLIAVVLLAGLGALGVIFAHAATDCVNTAPCAAAGTPVAGSSWTLDFSDEFNDTVVDPAKWNLMEGGTMNKVTTHASNVSESGGSLNLTLASSSSGAEVCSCNSNNYMVPVGAYAEARVYFPGSGTSIYNWPAWWISGPNWPAAGEHDIAEGLGTLTVNYHSPSGSHNQGTIPGTWSNAYHTYGVHRQSTRADVYWDGAIVKSYSTDDNGVGEHLIFNVGAGNTAVYGAGSQIKVDWVRVWKPSGGTPNPTASATPTSTPTPGTTGTLTLDATADTYVATDAVNTNYGASPNLNVSLNTYHTLMRFNVAALPAGAQISSAVLRGYSTTAAPGSFVVHPASDSWAETSVTSSNQPGWDATEIGASGSLAANAYAQAGIPAARVPTSGNVSFGLSTTQGILGTLASRETATKPQLVITYTTPNNQKPADLNADKVVNVFDLSIMLAKWGDADAAADLNGNGKVDVFDLSILLSSWG